MLKGNQLVEVCWHPQTKDYYIGKGYLFTKMRDKFMVKAEDLSNGTHKSVVVICEYCGKEFTTSFCLYIKGKGTGKDCCNECRPKKYKENCLKNYGVSNMFELEEVKEKSKQTCLDKYGAENPSQVDFIKGKMEKTNLEIYGCKNPSSSKEVRRKITESNLIKYGVSNPSKLDGVKKRIKETNLERYGCTCTLHNDVIAEKVKNTNMLKYGVPYSTQALSVIRKMRKTLYENGNVPTSKAQRAVCDILKDIYGEENCLENYPYDKLNFDCLLRIDGNEIDVEYDGWYWHKNKQEHDKRRNYFLTKHGFKVLRIKANTMIPTKEQIIEAIDYLVKGNHSLTEIILDI